MRTRSGGLKQIFPALFYLPFILKEFMRAGGNGASPQNLLVPFNALSMKETFLLFLGHWLLKSDSVLSKRVLTYYEILGKIE